ncbi:hypothetical protein ACFXDP_22580 [Streptomyces sp. NPDC059374]|uniref:hypothetical protein n=1 Tax=Streptomyces sp. NPDC059374 TaxID=3346814 RepID=UPI0036C82521
MWWPPKFDFYAMGCYRLAGEDKLVRTLAGEVLRVGTDFDGTDRSPMRNAEARVTLGVTAAREGDLEQALSMGERALEGGRQSVSSLIMTSRELAAEMRRRYSSAPAAQDTSGGFTCSLSRNPDSCPAEQLNERA